MCTTCGCGNTDEIVIAKPGEKTGFIPTGELHVHNHDHHHGHDHDHSHTHGHDHHHHHEVVDVERDILSRNNLLAERNRGFFEAKNITAINMVSSPGSGKTMLLEKTLEGMGNEFPFYIIEGDQQTMNDANRIDKTGTPVVQVNTGQGCHLDSNMINQAIKELKPEDNAFVIIENVGNLVCPALFDLGENLRVVIISVTEGDDKPIKYPDMFASSQLCIINKTDLLPYVDFDMQKARDYALRVNHHLEFIELSAKTGEGMEQWFDYLRQMKK